MPAWDMAARWRAISSGERLWVKAAAWLIALAATWTLAVAPAIQTISDAGQRGIALERELQLLRRDQVRAAAMHKLPNPGREERLRALQESTSRLLGPQAQVSINGARVIVSLRAVRGDALGHWISEVRTNARLLPGELRVRALGAPSGSDGMWEGSVMLEAPE